MQYVHSTENFTGLTKTFLASGVNGALYGLGVMGLELFLFGAISRVMTEFENYRTQSEFERAYVFKMFFFVFIDGYLWWSTPPPHAHAPQLKPTCPRAHMSHEPRRAHEAPLHAHAQTACRLPQVLAARLRAHPDRALLRQLGRHVGARGACRGAAARLPLWVMYPPLSQWCTSSRRRSRPSRRSSVCSSSRPRRPCRHACHACILRAPPPQQCDALPHLPCLRPSPCRETPTLSSLSASTTIVTVVTTSAGVDHVVRDDRHLPGGREQLRDALLREPSADRALAHHHLALAALHAPHRAVRPEDVAPVGQRRARRVLRAAPLVAADTDDPAGASTPSPPSSTSCPSLQSPLAC